METNDFANAKLFQNKINIFFVFYNYNVQEKKIKNLPFEDPWM